jgi:hypothetical protein
VGSNSNALGNGGLLICGIISWIYHIAGIIHSIIAVVVIRTPHIIHIISASYIVCRVHAIPITIILVIHTVSITVILVTHTISNI